MKKQVKIGLMVMAALILATAPGWGASFHPVLEQEAAFVGATHVATITYADLTNTNLYTAQTISNLFNVTANQRVELIGMELVTAFNAGGSGTGSVCVTVGDGVAGADFFLDSTEINSNQSGVVYTKFGRAYQGVTTAIRTNLINGVTVQSATRTNVTGMTPQLGVSWTNYDVIVPQYATYTNYSAPVYQTVTLTNANFTVTNVFIAVTGVTWTATAYQECTNITLGNYVVQYMTNGTLTTEVQTSATNVTTTTDVQTRVTALTDSANGRKVYTTADTVDFAFTPNSANSLSQNTKGEVKFYFKVIR